MKRTANNGELKSYLSLKISKEIQTTHLKDPMTHPRGERHLHDGQTVIVKTISFAHNDSLLPSALSYKEYSCLKIRVKFFLL